MLLLLTLGVLADHAQFDCIGQRVLTIKLIWHHNAGSRKIAIVKSVAFLLCLLTVNTGVFTSEHLSKLFQKLPLCKHSNSSWSLVFKAGMNVLKWCWGQESSGWGFQPLLQIRIRPGYVQLEKNWYSCRTDLISRIITLIPVYFTCHFSILTHSASASVMLNVEHCITLSCSRFIYCIYKTVDSNSVYIVVYFYIPNISFFCRGGVEFAC